MSEFMDDGVDFGLHEECGVFGVYDFDGNDVASSIYYGLFSKIFSRLIILKLLVKLLNLYM